MIRLEIELKIGKAKLEVLHRDITGVSVDAVVNPANNMLWMGGGVPGAARQSGGQSIEQEALSKAPVEPGDAVITGTGNLSAKWIIHAVVSGQDLVMTESILRKAIRSVLDKTDELKCRSLAFPMLTSEHSQVEIHIAARILVEETVDYLIKDNRWLDSVVFVESDETLRKIINDALLEKFTRHG